MANPLTITRANDTVAWPEWKAEGLGPFSTGNCLRSPNTGGIFSPAGPGAELTIIWCGLVAARSSSVARNIAACALPGTNPDWWLRRTTAGAGAGELNVLWAGNVGNVIISNFFSGNDAERVVIGITLTNTSLAVYRNGQLVHSSSHAAGLVNNQYDFLIAALRNDTTVQAHYSPGTEYYYGAMYAVALDAAEHEQMYAHVWNEIKDRSQASGWPGIPAPAPGSADLVTRGITARWKVDEHGETGVDLTVHDTSGVDPGDLPPLFVQQMWYGPMQDRIIVAARLLTQTTEARIALSPSGNYDDAIYSDYLETDANSWIKGAVTGLAPGTQYSYRIEVGGTADTALPSVCRTLPAGITSFAFCSSACANTDSNHAVFDTIRERNPAFFLHAGDYHYLDIITNDVWKFREGFERTLAQSRQHQLYREQGILYTWDDHDYGPNGSDKHSPSRPAAREAYRRYVPHPPLALGDSPAINAAIYYGFTAGRVRFLLTDVRSERDSFTITDTESKRVLGPEQEEWFKQECLDAAAAGLAICWVSAFPWMGVLGEQNNDDGWPFYTFERTRLSDFLQANDLFRRMWVVSGDMHRLAVADPAASNYATDPQVPGFPIFQVAALHRPANLPKGGPYVLGPYPTTSSETSAQFGLIEVEDTGGETISVTFDGRLADNTSVWRTTYMLDLSPGGEPQPQEFSTATSVASAVTFAGTMAAEQPAALNSASTIVNAETLPGEISRGRAGNK